MSDAPVLNPDAIEALRAVSPDDGGQFLTELIDIFLADTPARMREIAAAIAAGDAPTATRAAHSIKGSAGNFGASALAKVALEMEADAKQGRLAEMQAKTPVLEREFAAVRDALNALRKP